MMTFILRCVFAVIFIAAIWWLGPQLALGPWRPFAGVAGRVVGAFAVALLVFVPTLVRRRWSAPAPSRRVAKEIHIPRRRVIETLRQLRQNDLTRQRSVWQRVWYRLTRAERDAHAWTLVIGPPGSGKSRLLAVVQGDPAATKASNASWSDASALPFDIRITDAGVLVDVEGRMVHGATAEDARQWRQLLRALRKRPRWRSIVVCVDASTWIAASAAARRQLADNLRAALHDIATQAGADVPVHLIVTGVDQLTGWPALLAALEENDLDQGLGMMPMAGASPAEWIETWSRWEYRLHDRIATIIRRCRFESRYVSQASLLAAVDALARLRACILDDARQIFPASSRRGCTLATVWLGSAAELELSDPGNGRRVQRSLAGTLLAPLRQLPSQWQQRRTASRWQTLLAWSATALLALAATWLLVDRYAWERDYIAKVNLAWQQSSRLALAWHPVNKDMHAPEAGEGLRYMADLLTLEKTQAPMISPFRQHARLNAAITRVLEDHLVRLLWPYVVSDVAGTLLVQLDSEPSAVPDSLRAYLMLADPKRRDPAALERWFVRHYWQRLALPGMTATDQAAFLFYLRTLFGIAEPARQPVAQSSPDLIRRARQVAAMQPLPARVVARLQENHAGSGTPVSLASAAGEGAALGLRRHSDASPTDVAVPSFFTVEAYRSLVNRDIDAAAAAVLDESGWLMGEAEHDASRIAAYATSQRLATEARRLYLEEYGRHWSSFLSDIRLRQVATLEDAAQLANYLAEPGSPLMRLVSFVTRQTSLRNGDAKHDSEAAPDLSESAALFAQIVTQRFEPLHRLQSPTGAGALQPLFEAVSDQITTLSSALRMRQVLPHQDGLSRLRAQQERLPDPARRVLGDLLDIVDAQTITRSRQTLSADTIGFGSNMCRRLVAGRYPIDRHASRDIGLDDFIRVFGPNGAMQAFFDSRLASYVDTGVMPWRARTPEAQRIVNGRTVRSFQDADGVRQAFFSQGQFGFGMILRPLGMDANVLEATLDIDGQIVSYAHGMGSPISVQWPGPRRGVSARLTMRGTDGREDTIAFEGPWALFRLYDAGLAGPLVNDARELRLSTRVGNFTLQLRAATRDFPLWLGALGSFQCPDTGGTYPRSPSND